MWSVWHEDHSQYYEPSRIDGNAPAVEWQSYDFVSLIPWLSGHLDSTIAVVMHATNIYERKNQKQWIN